MKHGAGGDFPNKILKPKALVARLQRGIAVVRGAKPGSTGEMDKYVGVALGKKHEVNGARHVVGSEEVLYG